MSSQIFSNLPDLLKWFIYSGGAILVASWVLEAIAKFQAQSPKVKKVISIGASCVLAFAAYALITYLPAAVFAALDPYFTIASGIVVLWNAGQVVHAVTKPNQP